jgi:hypothetical protein
MALLIWTNERTVKTAMRSGFTMSVKKSAKGWNWTIVNAHKVVARGTATSGPLGMKAVEAMFTARGTLRLTKKQRSQSAQTAWVTRRGGVVPKKRKKKPNPKRSLLTHLAWERRFRAKTATRRKERVLLTPEQRSQIATAAAAKRIKRAQAAERKRLKLIKQRKMARTQRTTKPMPVPMPKPVLVQDDRQDNNEDSAAA